MMMLLITIVDRRWMSSTNVTSVGRILRNLVNSTTILISIDFHQRLLTELIQAIQAVV